MSRPGDSPSPTSRFESAVAQDDRLRERQGRLAEMERVEIRAIARLVRPDAERRAVALSEILADHRRFRTHGPSFGAQPSAIQRAIVAEGWEGSTGRDKGAIGCDFLEQT